MFLHAVFTPPPLLLEAITHAVRSAEPSVSAPPSPHHPRRRALGRLAGRSVQVVERPVALVSGFELIPAGRLNLPIAGFGNVTMRDAFQAAEALKEESARWATPTLRFSGATVQGFPDHRSVVAMTLDGDVAELLSVARSVTQCVQRRGLRVDRRTFLPLLAVATIREAATPAQVMGFVTALESFKGEPWTVDHVSLMKRSFDTVSMDSLEYQRIPLG